MKTPPKPIGFLSDIDGLRAVAVLAVVLFHLRIPGLDGGYVGVDIFFVISGFLISGLLHGRIEDDSFSFSDFYANRVRRLIPAVLATVIGTMFASVVILQPQMLQAFAVSAIASVFSTANFVFFFESGYWDANSDLKPLLHMWSLGVEEQFYLFWPALLVLLTKIGHRHYLSGLIALFTVSLAACIFYTPINESAAFYLLPFRVWQFCLGAIAVEVWRRYSFALFTQQFLRATGLALSGMAIISFGEGIQFPGWAALIPSVGAALVLVAANADEPSPWLSNRLARWLGKVSYSLYLVHWPPIALYRCYTLGELDSTAQWGIAALTFVLAVLLHYGVEVRFYRRGHKPSGWQGVPKIALSASCASAVLLVAMNQYPGTFAMRDTVLSAERIVQYKTDRFQLVRRSCRVDKLDNPRACPEEPVDPVLFIGNSHEPDAYNALWRATNGASPSTFINFGSSNGCGELTIDDDWVKAENADCQHRLDALEASVDHINWRFIVYSALQPEIAIRAPFLKIFEVIKARQPNVRLVVFGDYIKGRVDCASLINQTGSAIACREPENVVYFGGEPSGDEVLHEPLSKLTDYYVDKIALLCTSNTLASCPSATPEGHPMSVDEHHLTWEFSQFLGAKLAEENPPWLQAMTLGGGTDEQSR